MSDAGQQNYAFAQKVANQPLQQYQGQMVADVAPQTQQSWNVAANSGNVGADQYNAATAGYLGALGQTPMNVSAGQISNTNLDPYMNPFTKDVINATLPGMQQANALSQNQQANAANSSNAFGGSRQGIQQGVAQAQGAQNIGQMLATLNSANFTQAQAAATGDINRRLTADTTNQAAQQAKINSDIQASQGLSNTGDCDEQEQRRQLQHAAVRRRGREHAGAEPNQLADGEVQPGVQLSAAAARDAALGAWDDAARHFNVESVDAANDDADGLGLDHPEGRRRGGGHLRHDVGQDDEDRHHQARQGSEDGSDDARLPLQGDPKSYPKVVGPMAQEVQEKYPDKVKRQGGKLTVDPEIMGYAGGTSFVQPSLAAFTPSSSPGVAKGIGAMSAFRPPLKLPRGATVAAMPKHFAFGTSNVAPNMDDVDLGMQMEGGGGISDLGGGDWGDKLKKLAGDLGGDPPSKPAAGGSQQQGASSGWNAPSMGYFRSGFARGSASVPGYGSGDSVPAMLTPGEAVLTPRAAQHVGRGNIAALNAFMPPVGMGQATAAMRAGARGIKGALANTKLRRPKIAGGLSG